MKKAIINGTNKFLTAFFTVLMVIITFISDIMMLSGIIVMKLQGCCKDEIVFVISRRFIEEGNFKYLVYFKERVKKFEELGLI